MLAKHILGMHIQVAPPVLQVIFSFSCYFDMEKKRTSTVGGSKGVLGLSYLMFYIFYPLVIQHSCGEYPIAKYHKRRIVFLEKPEAS